MLVIQGDHRERRRVDEAFIGSALGSGGRGGDDGGTAMPAIAAPPFKLVTCHTSTGVFVTNYVTSEASEFKYQGLGEEVKTDEAYTSVVDGGLNYGSDDGR
jgi:hypothetical protein